MIKHDSISKLLIILAVMITVYLTTFTPTVITMFPATLLITGLVMERFLERKLEYTNHMLSESTFRSVGFYTALALLGMLLTAQIQAHLFKGEIAQIAGYNLVLYSILIAIAEEQFFRGFITDWMITTLKHPYLAIVASALIFTVYHLARYGTSMNALTYVFAGGFLLSYVAYKSQRISPCMIAHLINNVWAAMSL